MAPGDLNEGVPATVLLSGCDTDVSRIAALVLGDRNSRIGAVNEGDCNTRTVLASSGGTDGNN